MRLDGETDDELSADDVAAIVTREKRELSADEIDDLTGLWARLLPALDYHARKWYAPDENGDWQIVSAGNIIDLLDSLDVIDTASVMMQFRDRDKDVRAPHKITSKMVRDAQLRLGI